MRATGKHELAEDRIIAHFDCDCFEVQIFQLEHPETRGQPCLVSNKIGRISSVSYEARRLGISKSVPLEEAQAKCRAGTLGSELIVFWNDVEFGRVKDSKLREIGKKVQHATTNFINSKFVKNVPSEIAGNDEFYLDLTDEINERLGTNIQISEPSAHGLALHFEGPENHIQGSLQDFLPLAETDEFSLKLIHGAQLGIEIIQNIFETTGIQVSAGIGTNKLNAKLAGALNKPAAVTIIHPKGISQMSTKVLISAIPGLKKRLGEKIAELLNLETMHQLSLLTEQALLEKGFGINEIRKIRKFSNAECTEQVKARRMPAGATLSRKFTENRQNQIQEGTFESILESMCQGYWDRLREEETLNGRKLISGSISIKREERSINVSFDLTSCNSGEDLFQQIMTLLKNSTETKYEPWSNVLQISFKGKIFSKTS